MDYDLPLLPLKAEVETIQTLKKAASYASLRATYPKYKPSGVGNGWGMCRSIGKKGRLTRRRGERGEQNGN